jgi:carboxyl-terminal processing protease
MMLSHLRVRPAITAVLVAMIPFAASVAGQEARSAPLVATFDAAWQILRGNFVAETSAGVDWDALRDELRPRAAAARTPDAVRQVIREMLDRVGQSHFAVLPAPLASDLATSTVEPDHVGTLGLTVVPYQNRLLVTRVAAEGPASREGIRPGWLLTEVDGRSVGDSLEQVLSNEPHVQAFQQWAVGTALLRGSRGTPATLGFVDGAGHAVERVLTRGPEPGQPVKLGHLPTLFARLTSDEVRRNDQRFGVVSFNVWMTPLSREFDAAIDRFRDADGIVIDLRGNPGGVLTMTMGISGHFLETPVALGTIRTRESELKLVSNPRRVAPDGQPVTPFGGPVAILVDSGSYSASEIFTAGMQSLGRVRVFGVRTAGGALPAVLERLPGGDVLQYAIGDFVTSQGERIEGRGVQPDVVVSPTPAELLAGTDRALEYALDWMAAETEER